MSKGEEGLLTSLPDAEITVIDTVKVTPKFAESDYWAIEKLQLWDKNPRSIKDDRFTELKTRLKRQGQIKPLLITKQGIVIGGNMRLRAMTELGWDKVWVSVTEAVTDKEIFDLALTDNEEFGYYEKEQLAELAMALHLTPLELQSYELNLGKTTTLDLVLDEFQPTPEEDEVPEVDEVNEPESVLGEVYQLGKHRLMCGSATEQGDVALLMDGAKADMVFTDPPYGMGKEKDGVLNDNFYSDKLLDFNKQWIPISLDATKENGSWYCWGIDEPLMDIYVFILRPMQKSSQLTFRNLLTWDKSNGQGQMAEEFRSYAIADEKCIFVMKGVQGFNTNSDNYYEEWEPIRKYLDDERKKLCWTDKIVADFFGFHPRMANHWFSKSQWTLPTQEQYRRLQLEANNHAFKREYEDIKREWMLTRSYFNNTHDNMNNVWHFQRTGTDERLDTGEHATPKPLALCIRSIKSSSQEAQIVLDLFGGSGSTLIACEQTNRICYMMELDPKYCDVIRKRYYKHTFGELDSEQDDWIANTPCVNKELAHA